VASALSRDILNLRIAPDVCLPVWWRLMIAGEAGITPSIDYRE
jgi:hypothetical protein